MKFEIFLEFLLWSLLRVKGLNLAEEVANCFYLNGHFLGCYPQTRKFKQI